MSIESKGEKIKSVLRQGVGYFIVALTSAIYILTAIFVLDPTGKTLWQILGDGALSFFLGVFINRFFDLQGMINGDRDDKVIETNKLHGQTVERIVPYINELDGWCETENVKNYIIQRTKILSRAGLKYQDYFTEDGISKPYKPLFTKEVYVKPKATNKSEKILAKIKAQEVKNRNKQGLKEEKYRVKCYWLAVRLKLTPLTSGALTSEGGRADDPGNLGETKKEYEKKSTIKDVIFKFCIAIFIGIYGVKLINDFSFLNLLWTALQVGLFLCMGLIKMLSAYSFVVNDFRGRVIKKIDNLEKFEGYISSNNKETKTITETEKVSDSKTVEYITDKAGENNG